MVHTFADDSTHARGSASQHLHVTVEPAFDFLSAEYRSLFEASAATAFQHPLWLDAFYRRLAPIQRARPVVVTGRDRRSGELQFLLPMIARQKSGARLIESTDLGVSDYAAPVIRAGWQIGPDAKRAVAAALPSADVVRIRPVREDHVEGWRALLDVPAEPAGFSAHASHHGTDHRAWRQRAMSDGFVKKLDRNARRLLEGGGRLRLLRDDGEIGRAIAIIRDLRRGRFEGDPIQQQAYFDFYTEIAKAGVGEGITRVYVLENESGWIGATFNLAYRGALHHLLIGCDYDQYGRHSPGTVFYDAMSRDWAAAGGVTFDFTIGDEPYKASFGTEKTPMFELARGLNWRGKLARAALDARRRLRQRAATD